VVIDMLDEDATRALRQADPELLKAGLVRVIEREVVREFGRRRDVTSAAFGFYVEETADGPRYRFAWPN
jgi:hypothetical protein